MNEKVQRCPYRPTLNYCRLEGRHAPVCSNCLRGQMIDSIELLTDVLMEKHIDNVEKNLEANGYEYERV